MRLHFRRISTSHSGRTEVTPQFIIPIFVWIKNRQTICRITSTFAGCLSNDSLLAIVIHSHHVRIWWILQSIHFHSGVYAYFMLYARYNILVLDSLWCFAIINLAHVIWLSVWQSTEAGCKLFHVVCRWFAWFTFCC